MNPGRFVALGGAMLVGIGLAGLLGLLSRLSPASFFQPPRWINWFHLTLGSVLLAVRRRGSPRLQARVTVVGALFGLTLGGLGLLLGPAAAKRFQRPELADPSDHAAHLIVGLAALWSWLGQPPTAGAR